MTKTNMYKILIYCEDINNYKRKRNETFTKVEKKLFEFFVVFCLVVDVE